MARACVGAAPSSRKDIAAHHDRRYLSARCRTRRRARGHSAISGSEGSTGCAAGRVPLHLAVARVLAARESARTVCRSAAVVGRMLGTRTGMAFLLGYSNCYFTVRLCNVRPYGTLGNSSDRESEIGDGPPAGAGMLSSGRPDCVPTPYLTGGVNYYNLQHTRGHTSSHTHTNSPTRLALGTSCKSHALALSAAAKQSQPSSVFSVQRRNTILRLTVCPRRQLLRCMLD